LGKALFFDKTLSNPVGQACASCHAPETGFTFPDSQTNLALGPVPGAVQGRFGNRKPPTVSYAAFIPPGPTQSQIPGGGSQYVGGVFWDGRAQDLVAQVPGPLTNPNEMNDIVHNIASPSLVVAKVLNGPNAKLFAQAFGDVSHLTDAEVFQLICSAIATWEKSPEVSPFSSKYDAVLAGRAMFTASEQNGLRLFTGATTGRPGGPPNPRSAHCANCHSIPPFGTIGQHLFTNSSYVNTGVPKNPNNPYYKETDSVSNPLGFNPVGANYIDPGLGGFLYPKMGLPMGNVGAGSNGQGDFLKVNGTFKTPTLRNVGLAPAGGFVKCYSHNGVFKSLKDVVHFYNTRNLTSRVGEVIDFTKPNPYAGLSGKPIWPTPEYPSPVTLVNPAGLPGGIGNLGLTAQEETDIVNFLNTLSDAPPPPPGH
jgi:cytochrome c peroxidase